DLLGGRPVEELAGTLVSRQQRLDLPAQGRIAGADLVQVGGPCGGVVNVQRGAKDGLFAHDQASAGADNLSPLFTVRTFRRKLATIFQEFLAGSVSPSTSRRSQARAKAHNRPALRGEMFNASAASSSVSPAK